VQAFGVNNGSPSRSFTLNAIGTSPSLIPAAQLMSRTIVLRNADGTPRTDGIRVNGAAVRPLCQ
jgi:hypothetical protein